MVVLIETGFRQVWPGSRGTLFGLKTSRKVPEGAKECHAKLLNSANNAIWITDSGAGARESGPFAFEMVVSGTCSRNLSLFTFNFGMH